MADGNEVIERFGYRGQRVLVAGGGGAGMGAAAVTGLSALGAEVHVLDRKPPPVEVASHRTVDLADPDATAAAVGEIGGPLHALFNCAGLPGGKYADLDVMTVNFLAARHLAELASDLMFDGGAIATISSAAGVGWIANIAKWLPLVQTEGFAAGRQWCADHPEAIAGGYAPSKEAIIVWTLHASYALAARGIRINVIAPGPTDTPMMPDFEDQVGKEFMDNFPIPLGRRSTPEEQAAVLLFLNSRAASYVTGENIITDGGTVGAIMTGNIDPSILMPSGLGSTEG